MGIQVRAPVHASTDNEYTVGSCGRRLLIAIAELRELDALTRLAKMSQTS